MRDGDSGQPQSDFQERKKRKQQRPPHDFGNNDRHIHNSFQIIFQRNRYLCMAELPIVPITVETIVVTTAIIALLFSNAIAIEVSLNSLRYQASVKPFHHARTGIIKEKTIQRENGQIEKSVHQNPPTWLRFVSETSIG